MLLNLFKSEGVRQVQIEPTGAYGARLIFEPCERGFGTTLGNALRRVLLSSIPGYAVTQVSLVGIQHEYSAIPGVFEDVLNLLLNIKGLIFKGVPEGRDEITLTLLSSGAGPLLGGSVVLPHDLELVNPEHVIANLSEGAQLEMELTVQRGIGYVPGSWRQGALGEETRSSQGLLRLDASFSPVKKVSYRVENARVEQRTDLDRLILEIETNGAVSAHDALLSACQLLTAQFANLGTLLEAQTGARAVVIQPNQIVSPNRDGSVSSSQVFDEVLFDSIENIGLTARSVNCLKNENLFRVGDLVQKAETDLLRTPNLGRKSLNEIKEALAVRGLNLGMTLEGWV
jgi:DNA-directed RNA polymerase subunit alpha